MVNWEFPLNILLEDTVYFITHAPKSVQAGSPLLLSYLDVLGICLTAYYPRGKLIPSSSVCVA